MHENIVAYHASVRPEAVAVLSADRMLSFRQFDNEVKALQTLLSERVEITGIIGVWVSNPIDHWVVLLALARLGLPSLSLLAPNFLPFDVQVEGAGLTCVVSDLPLRLDKAELFMLAPGWQIDALKEPSKQTRFVRPPPNRLARLCFSSGSTGRPKLIAFDSSMLDRRISNGQLLGPVGSGRLLSVIGLDNWGGFLPPLLSWAAGGCVIFARQEEDWARLLLLYRPTLLITSPMHLALILRSIPPDFPVDSQLRIVVAGGILPLDLSFRAQQFLSPEIFVCYASTEAGFSSYGRAPRSAEAAGIAGVVLPWGDVEVVEENGRPVPRGSIGAIRVRGQEMISSYFGDNREDQAFREGWFYPGDVGLLTENDYLVIAGREGEILNCSGVKISPLPIEERLRQLKGVRDVAAVAIERNDGLIVPMAAVVVTPEFSVVAAEENLKQAGFMIPIIVVDRIARTPGLGKIIRSEVISQVILALNRTT